MRFHEWSDLVLGQVIRRNKSWNAHLLIASIGSISTTVL
jgi:hypothetical protein